MSTRLAARLARREVRRRPGRTLLVAAMIMVPTAAMTHGSVLAHAVNGPWGEKYRREFGRSHLAVRGDLAPGDLAAALPAGAHVTRLHRVWASMLPADPDLDAQGAQLFELRAGDPVLGDLVVATSGRLPGAPGEVLLDPKLAAGWNVRVGDTLRLERPHIDAKVVGIGRARTSHARAIVMSDAPIEQFRPDHVRTATLVTLPEPATRADLAALEAAVQRAVGTGDPAADSLQRYAIVSSLHGPSDEPSGAALAWGWVAGVLAMCVLGTVIVAAFATSARRQLTTLGQLAANGASVQVVRRSVALQGAWTGLIGSITGMAVGLAALRPMRGLVERSIERSIGPFDVRPIELVIIAATGVAAATIAASLPARTAARVPVLVALAGRRPLGRLPRRIVPLGIACSAAGVGILALVATASRNATASADDLLAGAAIIGGVAVLAGVCCISPALVSTFEGLGRHLRAAGRIAARSTARLRTRSAAVVTAIAAAGAIAVTGATWVSGIEAGDEQEQTIPNLPADAIRIWAPILPDPAEDTIEIGNGGPPVTTPSEHPDDPSEPRFGTVDPKLVERLRAMFPDATWTPRRYATFDPDGRDPGHMSRWTAPSTIDVADPTVLDVLGLSAGDRRSLAETGALILEDGSRPYLPPGAAPGGLPGVIEVTAHLESGVARFDAARSLDGVRTRADIWGTMLITEAKARELGFNVVDGGFDLRLTSPLDSSQRTALQRLNTDQWSSQAFLDAPEITGGSVAWQWSPHERRYGLVKLVLIGSMLLFTLIVVAMGLALSAAESRDERDTLVSVGARPGTLRRVAATKAALLAASGALLAVPAGFIPIAVVLLAQRQPDEPGDPIVFPWSTAAAITIAIPLVAAGVSWAASGVAQRLRPTRMSTLIVD